jgi:hypothetical protein
MTVLVVVMVAGKAVKRPPPLHAAVRHSVPKCALVITNVLVVTV